MPRVQGITEKSTKPPLLRLNFMSHGTLECVDLQETRRFYEEVLGFDVIQHTTGGVIARLGGNHAYVVLATGKLHEMSFMNHNGLDVGSPEEVDRAHELLESVSDEYGIRQLTPAKWQHGAYSFYIRDLDNNYWEILANSAGGYSAMFTRPEVDLTGITEEQLAKRPHFSDPLGDGSTDAGVSIP